jgi:ribosomal-protein-alanine N-acetyltransferase
MAANGPYEHISLLWAEPDIAPSLATVHAAAFTDPWDARALCTLLEAENAIAFFATVNQAADVVGFIVGRQLVDEAEIITLAVKPDARRAGVGKALLGGFERTAQAAGAERVVLEVSDRNAAARGLYEGAGYEMIARRTGYYPGDSEGAEDALVLEHRLPGPTAVSTL